MSNARNLSDLLESDGDVKSEYLDNASGGGGGGEANVQSDWSETDTSDDAHILNKPTVQYTSAISEGNSGLVPSAGSSGQYLQYNGTWATPPGSGGGEANVQSDWSQATTTEDDFIKNKPTTITTAQASAITANTAKTGITSGQASAITANTAKTGITSGQASAITANTAKTGITSGQASAIVANTAKTGITSGQASAITTNSAHSATAHAPSGAEANAANTAITTADTSWTGSQRATLVVDNDGSFDMNLGQNFKCSVSSGSVTLTFGSIANGQSGFILLINSGATMLAYAGSGGSGATKVDASLLGTISNNGTYLISYLSDGSDVYLTNSAIYT